MRAPAAADPYLFVGVANEWRKVMRIITRTSALVVALLVAAAFTAVAEESVPEQIKDGAKKTGEAIKDTAKTVGKKTKATAKAVGRRTKSTAKTVGRKTKEAAETVGEKSKEAWRETRADADGPGDERQ
jgi:gas vesicle protein